MLSCVLNLNYFYARHQDSSNHGACEDEVLGERVSTCNAFYKATQYWDIETNSVKCAPFLLFQ